MHKQIISAIVATLVLTLVGANSSVYALSGHGTSYGPSFGSTYAGSALGGTPLSYSDGLTINGNTFNIGKNIQQIPTQTLYVGSPVSITVKMWEYGGTYQIQGVAMFLNVRGANPNPGTSNTWIQYSKTDGVTVNDPKSFLGTTTVKATKVNKYWDVTFTLTPQKPMPTSWMIFTAWDNQLSSTTAKVSNAVQFSYVPFSYH